MTPKEDDKEELKLQKNIQDGVRYVHDKGDLQKIQESVEKASQKGERKSGDKSDSGKK